MLYISCIIKTNIMKTELEIQKRIKGLEYIKDKDLKRLGKNHHEYEQVKQGWELEIRVLKWVLNKK